MKGFAIYSTIVAGLGEKEGKEEEEELSCLSLIVRIKRFVEIGIVCCSADATILLFFLLLCRQDILKPQDSSLDLGSLAFD